MAAPDIRDLEQTLILAAIRCSDAVAEFDGDLSYCREYLDALWEAADLVKARYAEIDAEAAVWLQ